MPYIKQNKREPFDIVVGGALGGLLRKIPDPSGKDYYDYDEGELNYLISSIVWKLFDEHPSYSNGNKLVGVLECVKQEFIRRRLNKYEDEKIKQNGDL